MSGNVAIESVAYEVPPHRITSAWIEEQISETMSRIGVPQGQLEGLTGIRERLFWDPGVMPSEVAAMAGRKAIEAAGIDAGKIGCIINTSVCRDYIEPSVACLIHDNLKLSPNCMNYDLGNACLGFLNALDIMTLMIEAGQIDYGLIVDGEGSREVIEATVKRLQGPEVTAQMYSEHFATLTLGSGAVAMIVCHKDKSRSGHVVNRGVNLAATQYSRLCRGQRDYMVTDAKALLIAGVKVAAMTWKLACETLNNWSDDTIDAYIPHQVSKTNMKAVNKTLGLTPSKSYLTFPTLGNVGPASLPITLAMADETGHIKAGDHVALMGIGSGLNCAMISVTW